MLEKGFLLADLSSYHCNTHDSFFTLRTLKKNQLVRKVSSTILHNPHFQEGIIWHDIPPESNRYV